MGHVVEAAQRNIDHALPLALSHAGRFDVAEVEQAHEGIVLAEVDRADPAR